MRKQVIKETKVPQPPATKLKFPSGLWEKF